MFLWTLHIQSLVHRYTGVFHKSTVLNKSMSNENKIAQFKRCQEYATPTGGDITITLMPYRPIRGLKKQLPAGNLQLWVQLWTSSSSKTCRVVNRDYFVKVLDSAVTLVHFLCHCSCYVDVRISFSKASTSATSPNLNKQEKGAHYVVKVRKLRQLKTEFLNI